MPRIFLKPLGKVLYEYNMRRRKCDLVIISKIIKEELIKENKLD